MSNIGMGIQFFDSDINSGTGNYNSFLRIQNNGDEEGFNTDVHNQENNKDGNWTHTLLLNTLQTVTLPGDPVTTYYEIRLDLNETNSSTGPNITLEQLQLYYGGKAVSGAFAGLTKVYDLQDDNPGGSIDLVDSHSGSGSDDYVFYVPTALFPAGAQYLTLYADFSGADGGFEEFRVKSGAAAVTPEITIDKTADHVTINEGTPTDVTYTYSITNGNTPANDPLSLSTLIDDYGTPGNSSDDIDLLEGVDATHPLGIHYVSGDDGDGLLEDGETWVFNYTVENLHMNAGETRHNIVGVTAVDVFGTNASASDDWTVTAVGVDPSIHLEKDATPTSINEGTPTDIQYSYTLTNTGVDTDPLTVTSLVDDNGTPLNLGDDVQLITGVDAAHPLGIYYVSGDDGDGLLETGESWLFQYTREDVSRNFGDDLTNTAVVTAHDDENKTATDDDNATVTIVDVLPAIHVEKTASLDQVQAGQSTPVTFTYDVTNTSNTAFDPLTLTSLVDDMGTVATGDDVHLGDMIYAGGDDGDGLLELGETWEFKYSTNVTLDAGETRTNIVTATGQDDEGNVVSDTDDASITAYNLGRTPGFWANLKNGGKLWDGSDATWPNGGNLGTNSVANPGHDLMYKIHDTNGDGTADGPAAGTNGYLMIGDWDHDGFVDAGENVLVVTRDEALSLLNASEKSQQDGRWLIARDLVASWLNFLGGSYVGNANDTDSARHYIDEAVAYLRQTSANSDHVLNHVIDFTSGTKVSMSSSAWNMGFDFDADTVKGENMVPVTGDVLGAGTGLDILAGATIHSGLDHYNNYGFI